MKIILRHKNPVVRNFPWYRDLSVEASDADANHLYFLIDKKRFVSHEHKQQAALEFHGYKIIINLWEIQINSFYAIVYYSYPQVWGRSSAFIKVMQKKFVNGIFNTNVGAEC